MDEFPPIEEFWSAAMFPVPDEQHRLPCASDVVRDGVSALDQAVQMDDAGAILCLLQLIHDSSIFEDRVRVELHVMAYEQYFKGLETLLNFIFASDETRRTSYVQLLNEGVQWLIEAFSGKLQYVVEDVLRKRNSCVAHLFYVKLRGEKRRPGARRR